MDSFKIDNKKTFSKYIRRKRQLTDVEIQLLYEYAISHYYEFNDISAANGLLQRTSYLERKLRKQLFISMSHFAHL